MPACAVIREIVALTNEIFAKFQKLPLSYFDKNTKGEIISKVVNDIENVSQNQPQDIGDSSEKVIKRHFDKFKK